MWRAGAFGELMGELADGAGDGGNALNPVYFDQERSERHSVEMLLRFSVLKELIRRFSVRKIIISMFFFRRKGFTTNFRSAVHSP